MANFSRIDRAECVEKALPEGVTLNPSCTLVLQSVLNAIKEHGRSSMNQEVCGVLVGTLCWDKSPYLLIDARIEGKFADHHSGSVTFTADTWDYIHSELAKNYPDRRIVGWYHTHPGFGIFLSNMDFFIHENFFGVEWQPAYVFDPQAEKDGFFFWDGNNLKQEAVSVVPDALPLDKEPPQRIQEKISIVLPDENEAKKGKRRTAVLLLSAILLAMMLFVVMFVVLLGVLCASPREISSKPDENERDSTITKLKEDCKSLREICNDLSKKNSELSERFKKLQETCDALSKANNQKLSEQFKKLLKDFNALSKQYQELSTRIQQQDKFLKAIDQKEQSSKADLAPEENAPDPKPEPSPPETVQEEPWHWYYIFAPWKWSRK